MGHYVLVSELGTIFVETRLIDLADGTSGTDTLASPGSIAGPILEACVDNAENEIDDVLSLWYNTPISTVPRILKQYSGIIAVYNAFRRKPEFENAMEGQYDRVASWMDRVRKGTEKLAVEPTSGSADAILTTADAEDTDAPGLVFGGGGLDKF